VRDSYCTRCVVIMVTARCVCAGLGDEVLMQFGRVDKNRFTMDVRYPLSPFQVC
jgi:hypothetical protein